MKFADYEGFEQVDRGIRGPFLGIVRFERHQLFIEDFIIEAVEIFLYIIQFFILDLALNLANQFSQGPGLTDTRTSKLI